MLSGLFKEEHKGSGKGLGFLGDIGEFRFKMWLDSNVEAALREIGVQEGMRILDYGCGSGKYSIPACKLVGVKGMIYALDVDEKAMQSIKRATQSQGLTNITPSYYVEGSGIPIDDGSLDLVLLIDVIQEVRDWKRLFGDLLRVLKQEGALAVFPMHVDADRVADAAVASGFRYDGRAIREHFLLFTKTRDKH